MRLARPWRPPTAASCCSSRASDERYARIGTVAKIEDVGRLRNGTEALVIRGLHRAIVGLGVPGTGEATWVQVEPVDDPTRHRRADRSSRASTGRRSRTSSSRAASRSVAEFLRGIADPGAIADTAGYSPDLSFEQKIEVLETLDVEQRLEMVLGWAKDVARRARAEGEDPHATSARAWRSASASSCCASR